MFNFIYKSAIYAIGLLLLASPALANSGTIVRTQILMGTVPVTISLEPAMQNNEQAIQDMSESFELARRLETHIERDPAVLKKAREMNHLTQGYFDPRYGLGGIAKGSIVDRMAQQLRAKGYTRFLINAGGDIWAESPIAKPNWKVTLSESNAELCLNHHAVASSGTSERGQHIMNPRTDKAVADSSQIVTVLANSVETADALATAVFAADAKRDQLIKRILQKDESLGFIILNSKGQLDFMGNSDVGCRNSI